MNEFFILKKIDNELHDILKPVSFFEINPINIQIEKQKVMADQDYNPVFIYSDMVSDLNKVQIDLHSVDDYDSELGLLLEKKRKIYLDKADMLLSRGSPKFSIYARKVYGLPNKKILTKAAEMLTLETSSKERTIPSIKAVHMLQAELNHYGFDYSVYEREMSANAFVNISKRKIFIKNNQKFSPTYIKRLTVHEIGTHVLRAENGKTQPFKLFTHGFPDYLATEEGLAVINEERFGYLSNFTLKNYAARAIAVKMAQTKSFSEIYNYFLDFFKPDAAFKLTLRAKRGIADTSKSGGCPKDFVYLKGYLALKEFFKNIEDGKSDLTFEKAISLLYSGKVDLENLNMIKRLHWVSKPRYLPKNQSFKSLLSF